MKNSNYSFNTVHLLLQRDRRDYVNLNSAMNSLRDRLRQVIVQDRLGLEVNEELLEIAKAIFMVR